MLKFSIRELLLLTLTIALGVGWWIDRYDRHSLVAQAEKARAERAPYLMSAEYWREVALELAHLMRRDGWHVSIDERGRGWGYTSRHNIDRETADKLNKEMPIPAVKSRLVLPE